MTPDLSTTATEWATEGIAAVESWDTGRMRAIVGRALFSPRALPDLLDALVADGVPDPPERIGL